MERLILFSQREHFRRRLDLVKDSPKFPAAISKRKSAFHLLSVTSGIFSIMQCCIMLRNCPLGILCQLFAPAASCGLFVFIYFFSCSTA